MVILFSDSSESRCQLALVMSYVGSTGRLTVAKVCRTPVHKCMSVVQASVRDSFLTHRSCASPMLRFVMFWLLQLSGRRPVQWLLQKAFTATDQGLPVSCCQVCWDYRDKLAQVFSSAPWKSAFSPLVWASGWRPL